MRILKDTWSRTLARLPIAAQEEVGKALFVGGDRMVVEIRRSIVQGAIQGKGHIPSRPGEPPNREFGDLDGSVGARRTGRMSVEVFAGGSKAPHAVPLEFGTTRMAARPYMKPGAKKTRPQIVKIVRAAYRRAVKKARS